MVDFIAAISDGQRAMALDAAEHHYLQTVQNLGRTEGPVRMWASAFMSHLKEQIEQMTEQRVTGFRRRPA